MGKKNDNNSTEKKKKEKKFPQIPKVNFLVISLHI